MLSAEGAGHRREAWSADQRRQRHQSWRFNRRNVPNKEHEEFRTGPDEGQLGYDINGPAAAAALGMRGPEDGHSLRSLPAQYIRVRDGPTVIYTRELQDLQRQADFRHRDVYLEDIEGAGQIIDRRQVRGGISHRDVRINAEEDHDTDSMRRHEVERGSDLGRGSDYRRNDANRNIVNEGREYRLVLQRGGQARADEQTAADLSKVAASQREQFYIRDGNAEILRLVTRGRSEDEEEFAKVAPEPEHRPMTLVPPRHHNNVRADNGKEIIMQRFMEDQRNNGSREEAEEEGSDTGPLVRLRQQDMLLRRLLEEEARLNNTLLLTEALVAQRQHEQFLATAGENIETQSLPGQTTMATQTDVDSSTQTEPFHLMRPPRRRARSDNDDSYTEEEDQESQTMNEDAVGSNSLGKAIREFWNRKHRSKRRRSLFHRRDLRVKRAGWKNGLVVPGKRHKIKTPIMEETESALEAAERQQVHASFGNYSENKTSMLRRRNNKAKVATTSGEMEVTTLPNQLQSDLEDVEEETPTDSLEERSPSNKKYVSHNNRTDNYRRIQPPKSPMGDVGRANFDDSRFLSSKTRHVEFENKDTRGNSSQKRNASDIRHESVSEKDRNGTSSFAPSSDTTSGRPSEEGSSAEAGENENRAMSEFAHEGDKTVTRSARSETGIDVVAGSRQSRRSSFPNDVKLDKKERLSSRRGSLSEPGRTEKRDLSQQQTVSSRAKSLSQVNDVGKTAPAQKKGSRYMEWYKTKREERERRKKEEEEKKKDKQKKKHKPGQSSTSDSKVTKSRENEKQETLTKGGGVRKIVKEDVDKAMEKAEEQILKVTVFDDDMDSGIAMSSMLLGGGGKKKRNQQLLEKKSVFTIAYDDMHTKQLRPDSSSPQY